MIEQQVCRFGFFWVGDAGRRVAIAAACRHVIWDYVNGRGYGGFGISDQFDEIELGQVDVPCYEWEIGEGVATARRVASPGRPIPSWLWAG
jgi:hypothetical protein